MQDFKRIIGTAVGVALISIFVLTPVFACKKQEKASTGSAEHVYMAISPAILAGQANFDSAQTIMASQYIESQIAANGLTAREFSSLTPAQQRRVMLPGRQAALTREERRVMQLKQAALPMDIASAIRPEAVLSSDTIDKYGVALPTSVKASLRTPDSVSLMLFGNKLTAIAPNGLVLSVTTVEAL